MHRQKGITITGLVVGCVVVILILLLGFKLVPAYLEYSTIQKIFTTMAEDPALRNARRPDLERSWAARATVNENIRGMDGSLIEYTKEADGWVISAEYSKKVPLFRNVAMCIDFKPTSKQQ